MTLSSVFAGLVAAFVALIGLMVLATAVHKPLDWISLAVIATLVVGAGWLTAVRVGRRGT